MRRRRRTLKDQIAYFAVILEDRRRTGTQRLALPMANPIQFIIAFWAWFKIGDFTRAWGFAPLLFILQGWAGLVYIGVDSIKNIINFGSWLLAFEPV